MELFFVMYAFVIRSLTNSKFPVNRTLEFGNRPILVASLLYQTNTHYK
jgi:hypothetical protein